jgi:integrase
MAKISKTTVEKLNSGESLYDEQVKGFVVRCLDSGVLTYGFRYRNTGGTSRWMSLGLHGSITAEQARGFAKERAGQVAAGRDPVDEAQKVREAARKAKAVEANTVDVVLNAYLKAYALKLRSGHQIERIYNIYVRPRIGAKSIYTLAKSDIKGMLDEIEAKNGPVMRDRVLAHVRAAFNWQAGWDDDFKSPVVRAHTRKKTPSERGGRKRALADDEIRSLWTALDDPELPSSFSRILRVLLLTGQRRNEVSEMTAEELNGPIWTIPADRYKTGIDHEVYLTEAALKYVGDTKAGIMFPTTRGVRSFATFDPAKKALDGIIAKQRQEAGLRPMEHWTIHDLRRTARSLMSRAGVPGDIGELVLGHVLTGVRGTYDRHSYAKEKREALEKLAGLLELIVNPPVDNVVSLVVSK